MLGLLAKLPMALEVPANADKSYVRRERWAVNSAEETARKARRETATIRVMVRMYGFKAEKKPLKSGSLRKF
jgi:hypothetical protein